MDSLFEWEVQETRGFAMRRGHRKEFGMKRGRNNFSRRAGGHRDVTGCSVCKPGRHRNTNASKKMGRCFGHRSDCLLNLRRASSADLVHEEDQFPSSRQPTDDAAESGIGLPDRKWFKHNFQADFAFGLYHKLRLCKRKVPKRAKLVGYDIPSRPCPSKPKSIEPAVIIHVCSAFQGNHLATVTANPSETVMQIWADAENACSQHFASLLMGESLLEACRTLSSYGIDRETTIQAIITTKDAKEEAHWIQKLEQGCGIQFVPTHLRESRSIALTAVKVRSAAVKHLPFQLYWDPDIMLAAIQSDAKAYKFWNVAGISNRLHKLKPLIAAGFTSEQLSKLGFTAAEVNQPYA